MGASGAIPGERRMCRAETEARERPLELALLPPAVLETGRVRPAFRIAMAAAAAASAAMIVVERTRRIRADAVVRSGPAYEVAIAAAIAWFENAIPWDGAAFVRGGSSMTLWLAAFAFLAPVPPRAAVAAAACGQALHWAAHAELGPPLAPLNRLAIYYLPPFLMALAAGLVNARVLRLEREAARVRELARTSWKR